MTLRVVVRPSAAADLVEAHAWYEEQQPGVGRRFLDEVEAVMARIAQGPDHFPIALRDARRALVHRFPYAIYFRVRGDEARVLAVVHQHRHPRTWKRRVLR